MNYVDTHCHIDQYKDPLGVLKKAEARGVVCVAVTERPSNFRRLVLRLGARPLVRVAVGLHPMRAASATPMDLALFTQLLDQTEYVGEVGLDGSREGRPTLGKQIKVFEHLLEQPRIRDKVLTVHSRGAAEETIRRLGEARVTAILHWYSGALKHVDTALDAGLRFSINPAMLTSANGMKILSALPKDRVVTESDGPYCRFGSRPAEPSDTPSVVADIAGAWGMGAREAGELIHANMSAIAADARSNVSA